MCGEAAAVGVIVRDAGRPTSVKGLYVKQRKRPRSVEATDNGIGAVAQPSARTSHELLHRAASA